MPNRIKEFRKAGGLTLQELADRVGTTSQQIQRLETGQRRLTQEWMGRLGKVLGVAPAALLPTTSQSRGVIMEDPSEIRVITAWRQLTKNQRTLVTSLLEMVAKK